MKLRMVGLAVLVVIAGMIVTCSSLPAERDSISTPASTSPSGAGTPSSPLTVTSDGGRVTVKVSWKGEKDGYLLFDVGMDTHAVDLDGYDLKKLAVLQDDSGKEYAPQSWESSPGGHHRSGTLTFPLPDSIAQAKHIEVVIRDVSGVKERVLKWDL